MRQLRHRDRRGGGRLHGRARGRFEAAAAARAIQPRAPFSLLYSLAGAETRKNPGDEVKFVRFDGFVAPETVASYLAAADVGVAPNRSRPAISARARAARSTAKAARGLRPWMNQRPERVASTSACR